LDSFLCLRRHSIEMAPLSHDRLTIANIAAVKSIDKHPIFHEIDRDATPARMAAAAQIASNRELDRKYADSR